MTEYANLAAAAYTNKTPAGYKKDRRLSDRRSKVYTKNDKVYIAYRGTNPTNISDLWADARILTSTEAYSQRFMEAERKLHATRDKYPSAKPELLGHSLGGSLAAYVGHGNRLDKGVVTFNRGVSPLTQLGRALVGAKSKSKIQNYTTAIDPISIGTLIPNRNESTKTVAPLQIDVHSISNYV